MVKAIKKRVPKVKEEVTELDLSADAEVAEVEVVSKEEQAPIEAGDRFKMEVVANASSGDDRFSEMVEGGLLSLAENWVALLLLSSVCIGVYGFVKYQDSAAVREVAAGRSAIEASFQSYEDLQHQATRALKSSTTGDESALGLSVPTSAPVPSPEPKAFAEAASRLQSTQVSPQSAPLVSLAQASAQFDAAQTSADFIKTAELFAKVGQDQAVELIARGVALRNAAIAYEEAARLADEKGPIWAKAAAAWVDFSNANPEVFGLTAQVNRARVLRISGAVAEANAAYQEIQRAHEAALQDPKNRALSSEVKLGLALTGGSSTQSAETK
jgi:hypothetical protein